ncbi:MAG: hypothetical protein QXH80_03755, partial [Candidatus Nanoarchaeia archaeon]
MNLIFFAQGRTLEIFYQLLLRIEKQTQIGKIGFYVAGIDFYESFLKKYPGFENKYFILKEWDIYRDALSHGPNLDKITEYERRIGNPTLWTPIVTDRRLWYGSKMNYRQDYKPRFSKKMQLALLDIAIPRIESLFDEVMPDAICTIYTATFGDCLGQMIAKNRGIKGLDLRLTRQKNYVMFCDGVKEPDPYISKIYHKFLKEGVPPEIKKLSEEYLDAFSKKKQIYEGNPLAGLVKQKNKTSIPIKKIFTKPFEMIAKYFKYKTPPYCFDFHDLGTFKPVLYRQFLNPLHANIIKRRLKKELLALNEIKELDFILYPLHMEPEIVLAQFARPFLNQIEVIRNICLSMPVGMTLLVKEHPRMLGRRSWGYYKKLLEIPGVKIADFSISSEDLLKFCKLVVIIRGTIGLEAAIAKKPVITLG